jgi:hypothetical protein
MYYCILFIIILIAVALIFIYTSKVIQHFTDDLVGYNSSFVPDKKIETDFDLTSDNLETILNSSNLDKNYKEDLSEYDLFNENLEFPYVGIFKNIILNYFNRTVTIYKDDTCYISEIFNIHFKDYGDGSRTYILYINLVNPIKLFTKSLKVKLSIQNFTPFYIPQNITILYVAYDFNKTLDADGIDAYGGNFYIIKNKLHLMDPFLTTGKEMRVSKNMIDKFKTILEMKIQAQKMLEEKLKLKS